MLLLLAPLGWAADEDSCSASSTTSGVQFDLAVPGGQSVFRQGEIIPLLLTLSTNTTHRYWATSPMGEQFCVEPAAPDPLEKHLQNRILMGGGLFSWNELGAKPVTSDAILNAQFKVTPGHYRVYAVTSAVWHPAGPGERNSADQSPEGHIQELLRSNTVEFDVIAASPEWQAGQLQTAVSILSGPSSPEDALHAARILRYLDSKASIRELAKVLGNPKQNDSVATELSNGLFASSEPQLAIASMHKELAGPEEAMPGAFLETLVELEEDAEGSREPLAFDQAHPEAVQAYWKQQQDQRKQLIRAVIDEGVAALPAKTGAARAITLNTVLENGSDDPALVRQMRPALISAWKDLPRQTQSELIGFRWKLIADPEMLPILRDMLATHASPARNVFGVDREAALQDVFDLDPTEGRALILRDLLNPAADPSADLIKLLTPDEIATTLPRALDRIATNTAHNLDFVLLDRYADAGPLSLVQGAFESNLGKWGCAPQTNMLRYFLRVSPEYGAQQVRASMAERKDTECYRILLQDLGDKLSPAQQIAIDALDDPDPEVVQDAVIALGNWGTADAEAPLWASLQRLHDEWASRADELHMGPDFNSPTSHAAALEQGLAHAISAGRGWLCPPDKLARLSELLVISNERRQIDGLIKQWNDGTGTIDQQWVPEGSPTFTLLQYVQLTEAQLNAKLEQFPSGTKFAWQFWKPGQISPPVTMAKQEEFYERISAAAQQHGITIAKKIDP